ncbi:phage tail assembly chaperone [Kosakonia sacchari]|uniref:phage tail assembly chaperone n=1 Tax=Kosakonia sacchari TaxID=1158459 RepID=UPI002ACEB215|nr:phage tail assembly chaperone [Kosakonia sacchari]MDZ7322036.1 phage tail assembly chaperone [Kosakonia sacchari]
MSNPKPSLRALALTAATAFRTKIVTVPEWDGVKVTLREPSGEAWLTFREFLDATPDGEGEAALSSTQKFLRNKEADVILFTDILLDESGERVFSDDDRATLGNIYGPVHARLLRQAIELGMTQDEAEKK